MNTTKPDIMARVSSLETEMATAHVKAMHIEQMIRELSDDARFLRRTVITTIISLISAIVLMILGVLFQRLGT